MEIEIELWHLITLLLTFIGFLISLGKFFLSQINRQFKEQELLRQRHTDHIEKRFHKLESKSSENMERALSVEREFLQHKGTLASEYVRRDDWARNQSIIESKLDSLALRLDNFFKRGEK
ncbi:MAG: hypothetical protein Q9M50_14245 [Methylococcales bacterium]|nr:hypothetical protein [Methylococcales bacterium]